MLAELERTVDDLLAVGAESPVGDSEFTMCICCKMEASYRTSSFSSCSSNKLSTILRLRPKKAMEDPKPVNGGRSSFAS